MLCDDYKEAVMEAASGRAALAGSVHEHVATCARCGALLAEQRALFGAIDLGLRRSANAEIPNSFLPGVRARMAEESESPGARCLWCGRHWRRQRL